MLRKLRLLRFALVGLLNTALSFLVLNMVYYRFGIGKIWSSIIATSCALAFSFIANRSFVFRDKSKRATEQAPRFVIVTIIGSLLILNLVYAITIKLLEGREDGITSLIKSITGFSLSKSFIDINLSTVMGALFGLTWNYYGYKKFVFKQETTSHDTPVTN